MLFGTHKVNEKPQAVARYCFQHTWHNTVRNDKREGDRRHAQPTGAMTAVDCVNQDQVVTRETQHNKNERDYDNQSPNRERFLTAWIGDEKRDESVGCNTQVIIPPAVASNR